LAFGNIEHLKECVKVEKRNIKEEEGVTHREHKVVGRCDGVDRR
jgi:hypothetical protein